MDDIDDGRQRGDEPADAGRSWSGGRTWAASAVVIGLLVAGGLAAAAVAVAALASRPSGDLDTTTSEVTITLERDPGAVGGTLVATVRNDSKEPWPLECMEGELLRRDGSRWTPVGVGATWRTDDSLLTVYRGTAVGCEGSTGVLSPGDSAQRRLTPSGSTSPPTRRCLPAWVRPRSSRRASTDSS